MLEAGSGDAELDKWRPMGAVDALLFGSISWTTTLTWKIFPRWKPGMERLNEAEGRQRLKPRRTFGEIQGHLETWITPRSPNCANHDDFFGGTVRLQAAQTAWMC